MSDQYNTMSNQYDNNNGAFEEEFNAFMAGGGFSNGTIGDSTFGTMGAWDDNTDYSYLNNSFQPNAMTTPPAPAAAFQFMNGQQSTSMATPPASAAISQQQPTSTPQAAVIGSTTTPAAPYAAGSSASNNYAAATIDTPSKKGKQPSSKKQKLTSMQKASGPRYGLGIVQSHQQFPQGYQASTNPAHAHLHHNARAQYIALPPANTTTSSPPVIQMQNASLYTKEQSAQQFNAPVQTQQQSSSLSQNNVGFVQPAASSSIPDEFPVKETECEDIYTLAAKAKMQSLLSNTTPVDDNLEGLSGLPDLDAHVKYARQLFSTGSPKQLAEFLGSSAQKQTQIIADSAASAYAHQMFENESAENIEFFLTSSPEMKEQIMNNTAGFNPPMETMKRKRADSVIDGAPLYSPSTENFINSLHDSVPVFHQQGEQVEARLQWEAANASRDLQQARFHAMKAQQESIMRADQEAAAKARELTPETFEFAFGDDDSMLPGFEEDVEPADEYQEEVNAVTETTITDTDASSDPIAIPTSAVTASAFQDDSEDDMSSLFGDDDEESVATTAAPAIGGSIRLALPPKPLVPVYDEANAITQEDEDFAKLLLDDLNDFNDMVDGPSPNATPSMPTSHQQAQSYGTDSFNNFNNVDDSDLMGDEEQDEEQFEDELDTTHSSAPLHQNNSMPAASYPTTQQVAQPQQVAYQMQNSFPSQAPAQQTTPQQQMQSTFSATVPQTVPGQHYTATAQMQQYNPQPQYASPPQQHTFTPPTTQYSADDDDDLDDVVQDFIKQAATMVGQAPATQQPQYQTVIQPAPTAAGPDRPLCALYLASNGTNCPYGAACNDRHYYLQGPGGIAPDQAIGSQINYMATGFVQDQDMLQEGLMVTRFKRGTKFNCKNCGQQKPVTLKNDGVRCTPCFKRWCCGKD